MLAVWKRLHEVTTRAQVANGARCCRRAPQPPPDGAANPRPTAGIKDRPADEELFGALRTKKDGLANDDVQRDRSADGQDLKATDAVEGLQTRADGLRAPRRGGPAR